MLKALLGHSKVELYPSSDRPLELLPTSKWHPHMRRSILKAVLDINLCTHSRRPLGNMFDDFTKTLLSHLMPFNGINSHGIAVIDNAFFIRFQKYLRPSQVPSSI